MAYTFHDMTLGLMPIANTDSGVTQPNASSATPTLPMYPGMVARAFDPTYGEGEFILLAGVASTVVGSIVTYNSTSFTTTLAPNTANLAQPVAVAMAANTSASTWGWYQIGGVAVVKKTGVPVSPTVAIYLSATAGRVKSTAASGKQILGARSANAATVAAGTSTVQVIIDRPHAQGQVI